MKLFGKIFSVIILTYSHSIGQKVIINDLSYVIPREGEQSILQNSLEGNYTIEILTPRRYISEPGFYRAVISSDIILFYEPMPTGYSFDIYIISEELSTNEFRNILAELKDRTKKEYFDKNKRIEGFEYVIGEIISNLNICSLQLNVSPDDEFTPGVDSDKLLVEFLSECSDSDYKHLKFEVYSRLKAEPVYSEERNIQELKENKILWDGKLSGQASKFIRAADSPLTIKILLSKDSQFKSSVMGTTIVEIDKTVDEWNEYKSFFNGYVVKGEYPGTNFEYYRDKLKDALVKTIPEIHLPEGKSPLEYLQENLETVEFLGATFVTHKKFGEKLKNAESQLKNLGYYNELRSEYQNFINGSFALRRIAARDDMSPHSLACAIDIDPGRNPHVKDEWGRNIFSVINYVTNVNLYNNKPSIEEMKVANHKFKTDFNEGFILKLNKQSAISERSIQEVENKIKFDGELDKVFKYLYEQLSETLELYYDIEPAVTEEERKLETEYLDKIRGLTIQVNLHAKDVNTFLENQPSYDFSEALENKFQKDGLLLRNKGEVLGFLRKSSNYMEVNINHRENSISDIKTLYNTDALNKIREIYASVNAQKILLTSMATKGFFELDERIVRAFLTNSNLRWGGNFNYEKDFMHFELHPLSVNLR